MATKRLTRTQAKAALGDMPERSFAQLVSEGAPREGDGQRARFLWPELWHWYLKREREKVKANVAPLDTSLVESERREAAAKAELKELELAERRGSLMTVDVARAALADTLARLRAKLVNGPRQVALRVTGATIPDREREAQGVFDEIMGELAAGEDIPEDDAA